MANNCLVTRLKSVVNNENLIKLGEVDFLCYPIINPTAYDGFHVYSLYSQKSIEINIISDNPNLYFTLNDDGINLGRTITGTVFSKLKVNGIGENETATIRVSDMYSIYSISVTRFGYIDFNKAYFTGLTGELVAQNPNEDWNAIRMCTATSIQASTSNINLTDFLTKFPTVCGFMCTGNNTKLDLSIINGKGMTDVRCQSTYNDFVSGDISNLSSSYYTLRYFTFTNANNIYGDISVLSNFERLNLFNLSGCSNLTGNMSSLLNAPFVNNAQLTGIDIRGTQISINQETFDAFLAKGIYVSHD